MAQSALTLAAPQKHTMKSHKKEKSMEIIMNKWRIRGDQLGIHLETKTKPRKEGGKSGWGSSRFYPSLEIALMHLIDLDISDSDATSFEYVIAHIAKFKEEIVECLEKIEKKATNLPVMKHSGKESKSKLQKRVSASKNSSQKS